MKTHTIEYVKASDLFGGYREFWDSLVESDPPWTWGGATHTLILPEHLLENLRDEERYRKGWKELEEEIRNVMREGKLVDMES